MGTRGSSVHHESSTPCRSRLHCPCSWARAYSTGTPRTKTTRACSSCRTTPYSITLLPAVLKMACWLLVGQRDTSESSLRPLCTNPLLTTDKRHPSFPPLV